MAGFYFNTNGFPVIRADDRDPFVSFRHHRERGSAGGVDLVAAYGTLLKPPARVEILNRPWDGTGGHTVRMYELDARDRRTGVYDEYLHCSEFLRKNGEIVNPDQYVAKSGASGMGIMWRYDPHLHWHRYRNGIRINPWSEFVYPPPPVIAPPTPELSEEDEFMAMKIPIIQPDGTISSWEDAHMVIAELLRHSRDLTPDAVRDDVFGSTVLKQADGSPQPVTLGILADHTRVIVGNLGAQIAALTAVVNTLALANGLNPEELSTLVATKVDKALEDNFQAVPTGVAKEITDRLAAK